MQTRSLYSLLGVFAVALSLSGTVSAQAKFLRGDVNSDGRVSTADSLLGRRHIFLGGELDCQNAFDVDDDGRLMLTDSVVILRYLYLDNAPPAAPFPDVDIDETPSRFKCSSYEVTQPKQTQDVIELGEVSGRPGETVEIPVFVRSTRNIEAIQLVFTYDPEVFTPEETPTIRGASDIFSFDGTFYDGVELEIPMGVVSSDAEHGTLRVGFIPDLVLDRDQFPANTELPMLKLRGRISDNAPAGTTLKLVPTNDAEGPASKIRNELTHMGEGRLVSVEPELKPGLLQIVGDQIFFRGDSNADANVDLADALFTLGYLFRSGAKPTCMDAADADDNGHIDVTDAIFTLRYLFSPDGHLPPPSSAAGLDPSPDGLDCAVATQ